MDLELSIRAATLSAGGKLTVVGAAAMEVVEAGERFVEKRGEGGVVKRVVEDILLYRFFKYLPP